MNQKKVYVSKKQWMGYAFLINENAHSLNIFKKLFGINNNNNIHPHLTTTKPHTIQKNIYVFKKFFYAAVYFVEIFIFNNFSVSFFC